MSGKVAGEVWELELTRCQQWVLLAMADNAHDQGQKCFPGVEYLAWKTGYCRRQVQRILKELVDIELLEVVAYQNGGRGRATEYTIHTEKGVKKSPFRPVKDDKMSPNEPIKGDIVSPNGSAKGDIYTIKGDISGVKGDIQVSPQPSLEPSLETLVIETFVEESNGSGGSVRGETTPPPTKDPITLSCLEVLQKIPSCTGDPAHVAKRLTEYREEWPQVDALKVCKDLEVWLESHRSEKYDTRRLRRFFENAAQWKDKSQTSGFRQGEPQRVGPKKMQI